MLKKIMKKEEGFTLAELLIVVAIIAVLVAVSIPIFTSQLEKSRESTDIANLRAAKAEAVTIYLAGDTSTDTNVSWKTDGKPGAGFTAYYDATNWQLVKTAGDVSKGYGKGTATVGNASNTDMSYNPESGYTNKKIKVDVNASGNVGFTWE